MGVTLDPAEIELFAKQIEPHLSELNTFLNSAIPEIAADVQTSSTPSVYARNAVLKAAEHTCDRWSGLFRLMFSYTYLPSVDQALLGIEKRLAEGDEEGRASVVYGDLHQQVATEFCQLPHAVLSSIIERLASPILWEDKADVRETFLEHTGQWKEPDDGGQSPELARYVLKVLYSQLDPCDVANNLDEEKDSHGDDVRLQARLQTIVRGFVTLRLVTHVNVFEIRKSLESGQLAYVEVANVTEAEMTMAHANGQIFDETFQNPHKVRYALPEQGFLPNAATDDARERELLVSLLGVYESVSESMRNGPLDELAAELAGWLQVVIKRRKRTPYCCVRKHDESSQVVFESVAKLLDHQIAFISLEGLLEPYVEKTLRVVLGTRDV